jgi:hypothetical protein
MLVGSLQPVPSYHEAMVQSGFISTSGRSKSYSPSKVALLNEDFYEGDIPLQDTVSYKCLLLVILVYLCVAHHETLKD